MSCLFLGKMVKMHHLVPNKYTITTSNHMLSVSMVVTVISWKAMEQRMMAMLTMHAKLVATRDKLIWLKSLKVSNSHSD